MKTIIIDDDPLVSQALKMILETDSEVTVAAVGSDGAQAEALFSAHRPDIVLMDIRMKEMSGLEAGERLLSVYPEARILYLTTFSDDEYIVKALRLGAKGYLLKQKFESIVPALTAVMAGQSDFGEDILSRIPFGSPAKEKESVDLSLYGVTSKESALLSYIADGLSNREIAERLYVSEGTVRNAISILLEKLSLKSRTQLAVFFLRTQM